jgi:phage terminase large subunit-like protein
VSARHEIAKKLDRANPYTLELAAWRAQWLDMARPNQLPPTDNDWDVWALIAGRGFGKTRIGAEAVGYWAASMPGTRWAVVAPTQDDCRSVCFEGKSGILNVIPEAIAPRRNFNSQKLELRLRNGSLIVGKSAEKPDRLRGPQFHGAWCDELASWGASSSSGKGKKAPNGRLLDTWSNLQFGNRLKAESRFMPKPRIIVTTTPRPIDFLPQSGSGPADARR